MCLPPFAWMGPSFVEARAMCQCPVKDFWSVILYSNQTRSDQHFPSVSSQTKGLLVNADGSVMSISDPKPRRARKSTGRRPSPARAGTRSCVSTARSNRGPSLRVCSTPRRRPSRTLLGEASLRGPVAAAGKVEASGGSCAPKRRAVVEVLAFVTAPSTGGAPPSSEVVGLG